MRRPPRSQIAEIGDAVPERFAENAFKFPAESMQIESRTFNPHENLPKSRANRKSYFQSEENLRPKTGFHPSAFTF